MRNKATLASIIRQIATEKTAEQEGFVAVNAYNAQQTAILLMILPLILIFILTQRFFVEGIERSGLTG